MTHPRQFEAPRCRRLYGRRVARLQLDSRAMTPRRAAIGLGLAGAAAGAVVVRRTIGDLRTSRARLVAAAGRESRELERELHDGAQQRLVAANVRLGLARQLVPPGDELAVRLAALDETLEAALDALRELAHDIFPLVLAEEGLDAALKALAARSDIPVAVDATASRYAEAVESAVYYCCREALRNAAAHAGSGARVTIRVVEDAHGLRFAVTDTGRGFDTRAPRVGRGLSVMEDRLDTVGGSFRLESARGEGTKVSGVVPLPRRQ